MALYGLIAIALIVLIAVIWAFYSIHTYYPETDTWTAQ